MAEPTLALRFNGFGADFDFDFVPDNRRTRLGSSIVTDAKFFAADFRFGVETDASATPGIGDWAAELNRERDFFGDTVHAEVADQNIFVPLFLSTFADESNRRVFFSVKEVGSPKMGIPLGNAGIDACDLDCALGFFYGVVVHNHGTAEFVEFAVHIVDHQMAYRKAYGRMVGINIVTVSRKCADREQ